ncbi:MAG: hypothetical protein ACRENU_17220 [Gemmatimonadaceae bacterium]
MIIVGLWSIITAVILGAIIGRAYERNRLQQLFMDRTGRPSDEPKRLMDRLGDVRATPHPTNAQLAEAIDAIAVEVERIGEGQRFLAKVLTERSRTGGRTPSPIPGVVRSPIPPGA